MSLKNLLSGASILTAGVKKIISGETLIVTNFSKFNAGKVSDTSNSEIANIDTKVAAHPESTDKQIIYVKYDLSKVGKIIVRKEPTSTGHFFHVHHNDTTNLHGNFRLKESRIIQGLKYVYTAFPDGKELLPVHLIAQFVANCLKMRSLESLPSLWRLEFTTDWIAAGPNISYNRYKELIADAFLNAQSNHVVLQWLNKDVNLQPAEIEQPTPENNDHRIIPVVAIPYRYLLKQGDIRLGEFSIDQQYNTVHIFKDHQNHNRSLIEVIPWVVLNKANNNIDYLKDGKSPIEVTSDEISDYLSQPIMQHKLVKDSPAIISLRNKFVICEGDIQGTFEVYKCDENCERHLMGNFAIDDPVGYKYVTGDGKFKITKICSTNDVLNLVRVAYYISRYNSQSRVLDFDFHKTMGDSYSVYAFKAWKGMDYKELPITTEGLLD